VTASISEFPHRRAPAGARRWLSWAATALVLAVAAALIANAAQARPAYDAMGFLVWGQQALHLSLNLNGAPSWKPLPFLATAPYALFGRAAQEHLWTATSVFGSLVAVALAGHLAYRLAPRVRGRAWARLVGALFAAYGVATMGGFFYLALIANSDQIVVALLLGAIECHVAGRRKAALALLWLATLGRPEAFVFLALYAAWCWRERALALQPMTVALLSAPAIWFFVPLFTSKYLLQPSQFALGQATAIHGNKLIGVFDRLRTLTALPLQLAALATILVGLTRRQRPVIWLTAAALLWSLIELGFALHGFSAVQRYLIEPAAVLMVLVGIGVATALSSTRRPLFGLALVAVVALIVSLQPFTRTTSRYDHALISQAHTDAGVLHRLAALITADGGARRLRACGRPYSTLGYQSTVAWYLGLNVGSVYFDPRSAGRSHQPAVLIVPDGLGWRIRVLHPARADATACRRLDRSVSA
jgi:hypothetical protein